MHVVVSKMNWLRQLPGACRGVYAGGEQPQNSNAHVLGRRKKRRRSCSPLACRWHVVNLPGLSGK